MTDDVKVRLIMAGVLVAVVVIRIGWMYTPWGTRKLEREATAWLTALDAEFEAIRKECGILSGTPVFSVYAERHDPWRL
jgi:hypothetical protein